jgi:hypothetical protein
MSWDTKCRGSKRRYYYRSVRIGGRSVKQYIGRGPAAELIARLDDNARRDRRTARQEWRVEQIRLTTADLALDQVHGLVKLLVHAVLISQGWHEHHGEWRRRQ